MQTMRLRGILIFVICAGMAAALAGCGKPSSESPSTQPAKAPAPPPPPPEPPDTPAGKLVKVERVEKLSIQIYCMGKGNILQGKGGTEIFAMENMVCKAEEKAREGNQFVVLSFEGPTKRKVGGDVVRFVSKTVSQFLARVDDKAVLTDGTGKTYKDALLIVEKGKRQLVYEVPAGATDLVWKDGKEEFRLEPHPVAVTPAAGQ